MNGSPALYYVRACLASGAYATKPIEAQIGRTDVSVASTANLTGDMTGLMNSPLGGFVAGQNAVPLANVAFVNTTVGSENLHLRSGSLAINAASALDRYFSTDIDAALRAAPWDIGADEYGTTAAAGIGCAGGTVPSGTNYVLHGTFDGGATPALNNFTTSIWNGGVCPGDTGETIRTTTGPCGGVNVSITQFPGDTGSGIAGAGNSLYANGNNTGGPAILWRQTVTGLQQNTTYTFFLYASNGNNGAVVPASDPAHAAFLQGRDGARPYACATQLNAVDFSIPNEVDAGDIWRRYQVTFTTGAGETTADLAVLDAATESNGDDVQLTQFQVRACATTAVTLMSFEAAGSEAAVDLVVAHGLGNGQPRLQPAPVAVGLGSLDAPDVVAHSRPGLLGDGRKLRLARLGPDKRHALLLPSRGRGHEVRLDLPWSHLCRAAGGSRASASRGWRPGRQAVGAGSGGGSASSSCPSWALAQLGSSTSYTCETHGDPAATLPRPVPHLSLRTRRARDRRLPHRTRRLRPCPRPPPRLRLARRPARARPALEARSPRRCRRPPGPHRLHPGARQPLLLRTPSRRRRIPAGRRRPRRHRATGRREAELTLSRGAYPRVQARLAGEGFQGEDKTLALELMPLRYDASRGALVLSRRLTVRVDFAGVEPSEVGRGRLGRRLPGSRPDSSAYAFLATSQKGLHSVAFETLFPGRSRPLDLASLRLTHRPSG